MPIRESSARIAHEAARTAWGLRLSILGAVLTASLVAAVAFGQESVELRRLGIDFGWESIADLASALLAGLVVLWSLRSRTEAEDWERRLAGSHAILTVGRIAGLLLALVLAGLSIALTSISLERILVGVADLDRAASALARSSAVGAPLAALAPAVTALGRGARTRLALWLGLGLGGSGIFGLGIPIPLDRLLALGQLGAPDPTAAAAAAALATSAGVLLSLALDPRDLHRTDTVPCASASSATSTATSKP
jgi:hypothetical protein